MLDESTVELLEWRLDTKARPRPICATCGQEDVAHIIRTPLGFGCPWTRCLQFVGVPPLPRN